MQSTRVPFACRDMMKKRVWRKWSAEILRAAEFNSAIAGIMMIDFLAAKRAGFAGVRIQAGDGNPWFLYVPSRAENHAGANRPGRSLLSSALVKLRASGMCVVTSATVIFPPVRSMAKFSTPKRVAKNSVCPAKLEADLVHARLMDRAGDDGVDRSASRHRRPPASSAAGRGLRRFASRFA